MLHQINRLQIKDFRLILAIKQTGQLALAAELLSMTQPAASRMLAGIERAVGTGLFQRHPKGMTPTTIGDILARHAVNLLQGLDTADREVASVGSGLTGSARVGAVTGPAVGYVVPAIRRLKQTSTGTNIQVDVAPSDVLIERLINGEYDFVLSRIPSGTDARQFRIRRGQIESVRFVVRENHPLATRQAIDLADLAGYEWVIQPPPTPMRQAIEEAFTQGGIELPGDIVNTTSLLVMISYLESTDAIAPVSHEVAQLLAPEVANRSLVALDPRTPIVISPYHLISYRNRAMSPLAEKLMELVAEGLTSDAG